MSKISNNILRIKRSDVPGKIPNAGDLVLGELALNVADAILYTSGLTENSILPIGWDREEVSNKATNYNIINDTLYPTLLATENRYLKIDDALQLGETSTTAYRGDRGKIAYDHTNLLNNPHNVTAFQVGLGNVENLAPADLPISNATQAALDDKLDIDGDGSQLTNVDADTLDGLNSTDFALVNHTHPISDVTNLQSELNSIQTDISDNTSDIATNAGDIADNAGNISTNTGNISSNTTNISTNTSNILSHINDTTNPHNVTASQVGLGNVENLAPADLPISDATQAALDVHSSDISNLEAEQAVQNTNIANNASNIALKSNIVDTGNQLSSDPNNSTISLLDINGNVLDVLNVGFLNNEGTTLTYNSTNETIEIKNDAGDLLSSIPVSAFLSNLPDNIFLTGSVLQLRDSSNAVLSTVDFNISNINGLQAALDNKLDINGDGSQLTNVDAETLNGLDSTDFVKKTGDTMTGKLIIGSGITPYYNLNVKDAIGIQSTTGLSELVFRNSTGTLINNVSSTPMNFKTSNTVRLTIGSEGNVGIGTTNPIRKLDVNGTSRFNSFIGLDGSTDSSRTIFFTTNNLGTYATGEIRASALSLYNSSTEVVTVTGNKVGIGTSVPSEKLEVDGNIKGGQLISSNGIGNTEIILENTHVGNWADGDEIGKVNFYSKDTSGIGERSVSSIAAISENAGATLSSALSFNVSKYNENSFEAMRLTSDGNLGLNTPSPSSMLQLTDGDIYLGKSDTNSNTNIGIRMTEYDNTSFTGFYTSYNGLTNQFNIWSHSSNDSDVNNDVKRFSIHRDSGNVGIGDVPLATSYKLNVGGSVKANGDIVTDLNDNYLIGNSSSYPFSHTNTIGVRIGAANANSVDGPSGEIDFRRWNGSANLHDSVRITQTKKNGNGDRGLGIYVSKETTNSASSTLAMFIDTTQQVGIGTDNPSEKLEVDGNVKANNFIGNGSQLTNVDADTLDGLNSSDFVRKTGDIDETITGTKTFDEIKSANISIDSPLYLNLSRYNSSSTGITSVVAGSTSGSLIEGYVGGHMVMGIRHNNDPNDKLHIITNQAGTSFSDVNEYNTKVADFGYSSINLNSPTYINNNNIYVDGNVNTDGYLITKNASSQNTRIHGINSSNVEYIGSVDYNVTSTTIGNNTNQIYLRTNNTNRAAFNSNGAYIYGEGQGDSGKLELIDGENARKLVLRSSYYGTGWASVNTNTSGLNLGVEGDNIISINSTSRNVGIGGEFYPSEKLEVVGNVKADNFIGDGSQLINVDADTLDGQHASAFASANHSHNILYSTDDRDVKPNTSGIGSGVQAIRPFFTSLGGMTGSSDGKWQDLLVLDTYSDTSGKNANAITMDKLDGSMRIWNAAQDATSWGTGQRVFADNYHPNADKWTTPRTLSLIGDVTGSVSWDGSENVTVNTAVANDSHTHDSRYYTKSQVQTFINRGYISRHDASNLPVGWYTIATNTGDRASARFGIWDGNSGDHQSVTFYASHHFGNNSSNTLTVLDNSYFAGSPFRYIRIKDADTYDGAALQIYIDDAFNSVSCTILGDNFQSSGWELCDWIPDATTPPNVSNYGNFDERSRVDLDQIAQGGFATTGEIYAGDDTALNRVFHDGYHPNADKWTTPRTLSLTGDVTGSVSWDGSGNAVISTSVGNANTLDGLNSSDFVRRTGNISETITGVKTFEGVIVNNDIIASNYYLKTSNGISDTALVYDFFGGEEGLFDTGEDRNIAVKNNTDNTYEYGGTPGYAAITIDQYSNIDLKSNNLYVNRNSSGVVLAHDIYGNDSGLFDITGDQVVASKNIATGNYEYGGEPGNAVITIDGSGVNKGNVGIGKSNPLAGLEVSNSANTGRTLRVNQQNTSISTNIYTFEIDSRNHTANLGSAGAMKVDVNSGRAFTINGFGNVGIGTTSPSHPLTIVSSYPQIKIQQTSQTPSFTFGVGSSYAVFDGINTSGALLDIRDDGTSRIRIDASGNVGVGITSPSEKLDVNGNVRTSGDVIFRSERGLKVKNGNIKSVLRFDFPEITSEHGYFMFGNLTNTSSDLYTFFNYGGQTGVIIEHHNEKVKAKVFEGGDFIGNGSQLTNISSDNLNGYDETDFVKTSGNETITGTKTFDEIKVNGEVTATSFKTTSNIPTTSLTLNPSTTSSGNVSYTVINNRLIIRGEFTKTSYFETDVIFTLPVGARPNVSRRGICSVTDNTFANFIIETNGDFRILLNTFTPSTFIVDTEITLDLTLA